LINIAICERRLTGGSGGDESIPRGRRNTPEGASAGKILPIHNCDLCDLTYARNGNRRRFTESSADSCRFLLSTVPDDHVGRGADCDRSSRRRGRGGEGEDGTGHQRADCAKREDDGSENVTPNAHDYLHALTEVSAYDLASAARSDFIVQSFCSPVFGSLHKIE
jgi:hypothetical protein